MILCIVFSANPAIRKHFLRRWLKDPNIDTDDFRSVVDWDYYKDRLGKTIQKIIAIPAAMQGIGNPCPRVELPQWLLKMVRDRSSGLKQTSIKDVFFKLNGKNSSAKNLLSYVDNIRISGSGKKENTVGRNVASIGDLEDLMSTPNKSSKLKRAIESSEINAIDNGKPFEADTEETNADVATVAEDFDQNQALLNSENDTNHDATLLESFDSHKNGDNNNSEAQHDSASNLLEPETVALPPSGPLESETFQQWLKNRKSLWRSLRWRNKAGSSKLSSNATGGIFDNERESQSMRKRPMGVSDFLRNAADNIAHGVWQVLELQETETPGDIIAWVITSNQRVEDRRYGNSNGHAASNASIQLQKLVISVPRIIYVNCRDAKTEQVTLSALGGRKVQRDLPHGHPCLNLLEVAIPERRFSRGERALSRILSSSQVINEYVMSK